MNSTTKLQEKCGAFPKSISAGFCLLLVSVSIVFGQPIQYPHHFVYTGNPLVRTTGASDPSVHIWDGKIWMYTSKDHAPGYSAMDGYNVFSSSDLVHWTDHGEIFHSSKLNLDSWGKTTQKGWMWAPSAARKKNAKDEWVYYLYYPHNNKPAGQGEDWVTGVATAPNPWGPFTDHGILGGFPQWKAAMDPMVFFDDDGQAYIYSNGPWISKLSPDMLSLAEAPKTIDYALGRNDVTSNYGRQFAEGAYMHKRNGIYYYSYSNFHGENNMQGFYATGTGPYGPFTWKGPCAPKPAGAQDHHSIVEFQDNWYYFYHIAVKNYPRVRDGQSRISCVDNLYYNADGTIKMVVETTSQKTGILASDKNPILSAQMTQNFPNPFNRQTTITYSLSKPSFVKLTIYNNLGKALTTIVDQHQVSGNYSVTWNGTDCKGTQVSAGHYYYTLKTHDGTVTKIFHFLTSK